MKCLQQRFWHTSVARSGGQLITAKTEYGDSERELTAVISADAGSFIVRDAYWEYYSRDGTAKPGGKTSAPSLAGMEAYLGSGPKLRECLAETGDRQVYAAFAEIVRGIVQSETYLLKERGFASAADYDRQWDQFYSGNCRYYSNLSRVQCSWSDYVGVKEREQSLYTRFKNQQLFLLPTGLYLVIAGLSDSFHEITANIEFDQQGCILSAGGNFLRVPDPVCREAGDLLESLKGLKAVDLTKKEIASLLGKGEGCVHLIDVVYDAVEVMARSVGKRGR